MPQDHFVVLAINPGSTSTRLAAYEDECLLFDTKINHPAATLKDYASNVAQFPLRREAIRRALEEERFDVRRLSAVAGRGGKLPPVRQGAYRVDEGMIDFLSHRPVDDHASNLGALLAYDIARPLGVPAYIYDAVVMDQLEDIARLSGLPEMRRKASCHALNMRAMAIKAARERGWNLAEKTCIVCHMGAGISATVMHRGRMIDVITDEEGPYSPERSGGLPNRQLVDLCFSGQYDRLSATKRTRGRGGLMAYLGTNDALEVERRIAAGDAEARLVYDGMAYQVAKHMVSLAAVVEGRVDLLVLTGALAHSAYLRERILPRIGFLAPVAVLPGENELEALAFGVLRVLRGEEQPHTFKEGAPFCTEA
ncbi:butyrate kinase [Desulfovibrio legallii]|jgi:butyrate kinase|uniref:Probable butyrate kinase n=1 Tax=Desulfovibrio legallii TaxID=571438 RepID=A0A1G7IDW3_9BACT|nr:butyrate kinase [Desulfovibrio legallii]SDF10823.1 butyrate kinase [Desulfovibrio legallii]